MSETSEEIDRDDAGCYTGQPSLSESTRGYVIQFLRRNLFTVRLANGQCVTAAMPERFLPSAIAHMPGGLDRLTMSPALHSRLQELLDQQDRDGRLPARERREAKALTELVDLLTLLKLRAQVASDPLEL